MKSNKDSFVSMNDISRSALPVKRQAETLVMRLLHFHAKANSRLLTGD